MLSTPIYIISQFKIHANIKGSSLSLPAHGRAGARATSSLAAHFAKQNTNSAAESEGGPRRRNFVSLRGKQKFLLFACPVASRRLCYGARPSLKVFQNSAFGFSLKKVRISFRIRSLKTKIGLKPYFCF